jgi:SAM-dependent methyltransferase
MKLTKPQIKAHNEALEILKKDKLKEDEAIFVMENWREDAVHVNSAAGAFFTPWGLARDFALEVSGKTIIDLCAGIGNLSYFAYREGREITCVEMNPDYIAVGKKIMPEARWIQGSIFDLHFDTLFDCAISNPPFGAIGGLRDGLGGFEFSAINVASKLARAGVFILPQQSTPFKYSGQRNYEDLTGTDREPRKVRSFRDKTGIKFDFNLGIDTCYHIDQWHGVAPVCEVCTFDFTENKGQGELFA